MDLFYPARLKRPHPDPLVYSLRTMFHHLDVGRVFIAGGLPREIDPSRVTHIPTEQAGSKFSNIEENIWACLDSDISEDYLHLNEDFFVLQDFPGGFPLINRGPFVEYLSGLTTSSFDVDHNDFVDGMISQFRIMMDRGYSIDTSSTDLHCPIPLSKSRLRDLLLTLAEEYPDHPRGHFRAIYGASLDSVYYPDWKGKRREGLPPPGRWFISTGDQGWRGETGDLIRRTYWRPSPFEKVYQLDNALISS